MTSIAWRSSEREQKMARAGPKLGCDSVVLLIGARTTLSFVGPALFFDGGEMPADVSSRCEEMEALSRVCHRLALGSSVQAATCDAHSSPRATVKRFITPCNVGALPVCGC